MKSLNSIVLIGATLLLTACNSAPSATNTDTKKSPEPASSMASSEKQNDAGKPDNRKEGENKGGQVIESGPYHLEFAPSKEAGSTHLDFYLQKSDNHQAVPNAKVTAQITLPDATSKSLELAYDADGKHYTAKLPDKAVGDYKIVILSDIGGEKVNGRFTLKQ